MAKNQNTPFLFKTKLNYMNPEKKHKEYKKIENILNMVYEINKKYSYKDVLKIIENSTLIEYVKKNYAHEVMTNISKIENKKICTISEIHDQSHDIINELKNYIKLKYLNFGYSKDHFFQSYFLKL